jgi:hypothetical protein
MGALLEEDLEERTKDRPELKGKRSQGLGSPPGPGARLLEVTGAAGIKKPRLFRPGPGLATLVTFAHHDSFVAVVTFSIDG